ncbi:hypothetical protein SAMN05428988_0923 [Chitinophaga sp. YR573]|uniref:tail fiber protein n=1 Tax=Chitinophaga sp. YR573 TaxID=1881040 RepID=UPI0008AE2C76|nr:tail fiber protein [Chitinophaga sp. YR573]SEV97513.1 hypothetical protein SAMN05428988_0923 [Chitinophaga sp. YR573]
MKKAFIAGLILVFTSHIQAQTFTTTGRTMINNAVDDGSNALQVNGTSIMNGYLRIRSTNGQNPIIGGRNPLYLDARNYTNNSSNIVFTKTDSSIAEIGTDVFANGGKDLYMIAGSGNANIFMMPFSGNGNVGIGTTTPQSKLAVAGTITAQRVKVTSTGWPDFVFHRDYKLPSLQETAAYINSHQHLPGIPSAEEVEKDGQDVGEMNKLLLQKIEELTLHLIKLEEEVNTLKAGK